MLKGISPGESIHLLYKYGVLSLLLRFPATCDPLKDLGLLNNLVRKSVLISTVLAHYSKLAKVHFPESTNLLINALIKSSLANFSESHLQ